MAVVVLTLYALPTAVVAVLVARIGGAGNLVLPMVLLALGLVAAPAGPVHPLDLPTITGARQLRRR